MDEQKIRETIECILTQMGASFTIEVIPAHDDEFGTRFLISTDEPHILIGPRGAHLGALTHVVRKIMERGGKEEPRPHFIIDVNHYQEKKIEQLRNKARILAERARSFKSNIEMEPMSPYERMVVHTVLAEIMDIETESTGQGRERRVVIRYVTKSEEPLL